MQKEDVFIENCEGPNIFFKFKINDLSEPKLQFIIPAMSVLHPRRPNWEHLLLSVLDVEILQENY